MKTFSTILFIGIIIVISPAFHYYEDIPFLLKLKEKVRSYHTAYPEEKVYVQTDKPFYKPGDIIWFNAFVLNSNSHQPTSVSDIVYIELIDPKGNVTVKAELVVNEGTANGDFFLQENAPGGIYQIRAYTLWMKNFGAATFFEKELQVQKIIAPRLLLKLNFEKESYGSGDYAIAKLTVANLKNEPLAKTKFEFSVNLSGKKVIHSSSMTEVDGTAFIKFQLPDTLQTSDGLLNVIVKADGLAESISRSIPIILNKIEVNFFPEGGQYAVNVPSRIAFKALNEFGKGADIEGVIVDQNNHQVSRFESYHMGMGSFEFTPAEGDIYFARIEKPSGNTSLIALPSPSIEAYTLNLNNKSKSSLEWNIHSPKEGHIYMVGNAHGEIVYAEKIPVDEGKNQLIIPTEKFPAGIAVFTLFDQYNQPWCERLVFLNNENGLKIELATDKTKYNPGESVDVEIKTSDTSGKPIRARISLAVVDDKILSFADDKQDNLLSSMLLSSEVKGEIQEPSFYFDPKEPKASKALDNLLMTQGWRRFSWSEILDKKMNITYAPEKIKNIGGTVRNANGMGYQAEVTLIELAGRKRIVKVTTTSDGHFIIKNIDPKIPYLLLTKKPGEITIQKNPSKSISLNDKAGSVLLPDIINDDISIAENTIQKNESDANDSGLDLALSADITELSEIVVTGFGVQESSSLSGSVTRIYINKDESIFSHPAIENALQGRVAGIIVQQQTGNPGSHTNLMVRGISTFGSGSKEPLYVIDGHPIGNSLSRNFSNGSMVGPEKIESIEVITTPEMTALFGSQASNGVILITTKSRIGYTPFASNRKPAKFTSQFITPRRFTQSREFYIPPGKKGDEGRKDFRTTIYWNHTLVTDEKGKASISFRNNDAVSAFRITAEGFSASGLLGRNEQVYFTELPLSLDAKLPEFLGYEDILKLPVRIKNETSALQTGTIKINIPDGLQVDESLTQTLSVEPGQTKTIIYTIHPKGITGKFPVSLVLQTQHFTDQINEVIQVRPVGFPVKVSFSAKTLNLEETLFLKDAEKNSVTAELTAFPDLLNDLFSGAESILRQPYGCFEQVSSSTFPNILALQYLKQSGLVNERTENLAMNYIRDGYKKLTAYEIPGGGFEWFGHPPAHEGLTAYGLLQFNEMKKVYAQVDKEMLERTRQWLMDRRDGRGGFKQGAGKYGFSSASKHVTNAYITYALSETGSSNILAEYTEAYSEVLKSQDMYRMALVACTAFNLGKMDDYEKLVSLFQKNITETNFDNLKSEHSIVRSYGNSLKTETISLWAIALMKNSGIQKFQSINLCIHEILKGRSFGEFGSTQGTALALKALSEYAKIIKTTRQDGEIGIWINDKIAEQKQYRKETREKIVLKDFAKDIVLNQEQKLKIQFTGTNEPIPYSIDIQWYTKLPNADTQCKVSVTTSLSSETVYVNETVRLSAIIRNKTKDGLPMTIAVLGIPSGLSAQPWQLKELQEKGVFDFYEIQHGNLVIYFREMAPAGQTTILLDLKAEVPGTFTGTASSAYLYYTNEHKDWIRGNSITIH